MRARSRGPARVAPDSRSHMGSGEKRRRRTRGGKCGHARRRRNLTPNSLQLPVFLTLLSCSLHHSIFLAHENMNTRRRRHFKSGLFLEEHNEI